MGLLDFDLSKALNSDRGRLGLGLLAAAGPSNQGFGQRLQSALGYVQGQQDRDSQKQMQQFQMQELLAQAAARKREADKQAKSDAEEQAVNELAKRFSTPATQGTVDTSGVNAALPDYLRINPTPAIPAQAGGFDQKGFLANLPSVLNPLKAMEYSKKFAPKEVEYSTAPQFTPDGRAYLVGKDGSVKWLDGGIKPRERLHFQDVGGEVKGIDPFTGKPVSTLPKSGNPFSDLVVRGADGSMVPNAPLMGAKKQVAAAGASRNSTTVINKGADAFDVETAKLDAKELETLREGAKTAQSVLGTVASLRAAEKQGAYSGGGADARLAAANLIEGWTGIAPKGLVGSQIYNAEANKLILDRVKALGANPSNADREFLQKTVPQLATNAQARTAMADWMERQAQRSIKTYQDADAYARKNRGLGGFNSAPTQMDAPTSSVVDYGSLK